MQTTRAVLDSSPVKAPSRPSNKLKRSASTASLPTPPRTRHKRKSRSRSKPVDTDSDDSESGSELGGTTKRRRVSGEETDGELSETEFWTGRKTETSTTAVAGSRDRSRTPSETPSPVAMTKFVKAPVSPPPSRRQTIGALITPPKKGGRVERASDSPVAAPRSASPSPRDQGPERDSPNNPFLSESPSTPAAPRTPPAGERPTVTYVFRGQKRVFQNPYYDLPPDANAKSLLPPEHDDYEPDSAAVPKLLFPAKNGTKRRPTEPKTPPRRRRVREAGEANPAQ